MVFFLSFSLSKFLVHFSYWRSNRLCCLHCKTDNLRLVFSPLQYVDRLGKGRRNLFSFSSSSPFSSSFHITPSSPANLLSPGNNEMGIMQRGEKGRGCWRRAAKGFSSSSSSAVLREGDTVPVEIFSLFFLLPLTPFPDPPSPSSSSSSFWGPFRHAPAPARRQK